MSVDSCLLLAMHAQMCHHATPVSWAHVPLSALVSCMAVMQCSCIAANAQVHIWVDQLK